MKKIKVVGGGCATCHKLADMCKTIIDNNNVNAEIEKVTDLNKFAELGIFMTPGLIINDEVKSSGKLPDETTLEKWIIEK